MYSKNSSYETRKRAVVTILLVVFALLAFPLAVSAQAVTPQAGTATGPVEFGGLVAELMGLAGFAGLVTLGINIAKTVGVVKDGQAPTVSAIVNFIGLGILMAVRIFKPDLDVGAVDGQMQSFVQVGTVVFAYILQLLSSKGAHYALAGVPVIGKSFTLDKAKTTPPVTQ